MTALVDRDEWVLLLARLVATAIDVLDEHQHDDLHSCRSCGARWPCTAACTAEMNLALVRR